MKVLVREKLSGAGLDRLREHFDVDVRTGMSPDELADAIKRVNPKMPVVLVTGFADRLTVSGRQDSPFDLIVRKPFTRETLKAALHLVCS